jgi:hypothetical protein
MSRRLPPSGRTAARALIALAAVCCCLGAALAYAATQPRRQQTAAAARPPQPRFTMVPKRTGSATRARFAFTEGAAAGASLASLFQCSLDHAAWRACHSPVRLRHLGPGRHRFAVRAVNRLGAHSRSAKFSWLVLEAAAPSATPVAPPASVTGEPFRIEPDLASLQDLYPGMAPEPLPVSISNPNSVTIYVTSLEAKIDPDPAECPSAPNFALAPASIPEASPVVVPAGGTVSLPSQGASAPTIAMLDLPISQDACQGIDLPLAFSGEAHG